MKKFKFRLQKLLDVKAAAEKVIQHELSAEIAKQNILREKQRVLRDKVKQQQHQFHDSMAEQKNAFRDLTVFHRYSEFADMVIVNSEAEIEAMQPKINEIRDRLNEAAKERRSIEKLKERKFNDWKYKANRAEEQELEEINARIYYNQQLRRHYDT